MGSQRNNFDFNYNFLGIIIPLKRTLELFLQLHWKVEKPSYILKQKKV